MGGCVEGRWMASRRGCTYFGLGSVGLLPFAMSRGEGSTAGIAKEGEAPRKSGDGGGDLVHLRVVDDGEGRRGYICRGGAFIVTQVTSNTLLFERAVVDAAARLAGWEGVAALLLQLRWRGSFWVKGGTSWWMAGL